VHSLLRLALQYEMLFAEIVHLRKYPQTSSALRQNKVAVMLLRYHVPG
jgi:hypothetical protein